MDGAIRDYQFLAGKSRRLYKTPPAYAGQASAEFTPAKDEVAAANRTAQCIYTCDF